MATNVINVRHRRTAESFRKWVAVNPKASKKRRVEAFNAIADTEFQQIKNNKTKVKKAVRSIKRI